ncbi:uncharacterized protein LOC121991358 [Zingiber officinale]|uniref:uncharacterized protein LOC121991358 n=1 Tax=Zingiber officinale TaxID=94328 RepID=UPI001C4D1B93|nr:uncharacterized protein LOC121991358 [Zingiber officinale]
MEIDYQTRLTAMLDVTHFLLKQGLPFRGHDQLTSSSNREITLAIINDIRDKFFSLMVDETQDSLVKEHMGVVLRYVNKKGCVIERFLAVVHVPDTSSHSSKMAIDALFVQHGLSLSRLRDQGYDEASNMRGEFNGLKSLILQENLFSMYVHCFSHQLQLILFAVAHDNFTVSEFFGYITMIVNISGASLIEVLGNVHDDASYSANKGVAADNMLTRGHGRHRGQLITNFHHYRVEIFCQDDPYFSSIDDLGILAQKLVETEKHLMFPLVYRMIELSLLLPVATASVERVFSAMKTVKTDLHNRMRDEWMNDSLVVYIENDIFSTIENEQVMENRLSIKWDKGKTLDSRVLVSWILGKI